MTDVDIITAHAEGEVGNVIVGGVAPPPGATLWDQRDWLAADRGLRDLVLSEPRGGLHVHANLLVPPKNPDAAAAFLIMEPVHTPPMSGSNTICVATVCLEAGIVPMTEPVTEFALEVPAGLIPIRATCRNGKAQSIRLTNVPSFADRLDAPLEMAGMPTLSVDTAWGGDSFVFVDADALGLSLTPDEGREIADLGAAITAAANEQIGFSHPTQPWSHISFCFFAGPVRTTEDGTRTATGAVVIEPGKIDRSPTGTGCSARMALMAARGQLGLDERFVGRSIIGGRFDCAVAALTRVGDRPAIVPTIEGRAWITGRQTLAVDPTDPWPRGYQVGDTWPLTRNVDKPRRRE